MLFSSVPGGDQIARHARWHQQNIVHVRAHVQVQNHYTLQAIYSLQLMCITPQAVKGFYYLPAAAFPPNPTQVPKMHVTSLWMVMEVTAR